VFFAAFAFFGAIVFLPRWFQVVEGYSPTNSGLALLPLMVGLIGSSVISGLIVSRTGRYKLLIVGSTLVMGFAVLLMTQLTKDTPVPVVWLWMFLAGLGVGTTFSVPTIVIQNAVPFRQLGVATSNLTFFRQIGGTIALAFVGTIFATSFQDNLIPQMSAAGVPQQVIDGFTQASSSGSFDFNSLTGTGDLGVAIMAAIPAQFQAGIQPFIGLLVQGVHGAFSLATAQAFWLGVVGSVMAFLAALAIKEIPLRTTNEMPVAARPLAGAGAPSGKPESVAVNTAAGD
jgi:MFS family permease